MDKKLVRHLEVWFKFIVSYLATVILIQNIDKLLC
jgi:hypothetical protein